MQFKKPLGLVAVVGVAAAILIATAGAAPGPAKPQPKLHFTSSAAVLTYLKSHGINTRGIVIQRGARTYAGAKCPGKAWSCTRAHRVIQFATLSSTFQCSPSYPTGGSSTYPDSCTVVQVSTTGNNNAKCVEQTTNAGPSQYCSITQTSGTGKNDATVFQLINQSSGQSQTGSQEAHVKQVSTTGSNTATVLQTIWQTTSTYSSAVNQDQNGTQTNDIKQDSTSGTQFSTMSQATLQTETAKHATSGSQDQTGDGQSDTNQSSSGVSKSYNFQNMLQVEKAKEDSPVVQSQTGPYRCCSFQSGNSNDVFFLEQSKSQFRSYEYGTSGNQFASSDGFLSTDGHGHISQFSNQNGTRDSNSCDVNNGACAATLIVENGTTTTKCTESGSEPFCGPPVGPPPPPPPAPPAPNPPPNFAPSSHASR